MIVKFFINAFKSVLIFLINALPTISFDFVTDSDIFDKIYNIFSVAFYFLPMNDIIAILAISFAIKNFEILWSLIVRVWTALPFT